jgi:hypothetical protein
LKRKKDDQLMLTFPNVLQRAIRTMSIQRLLMSPAWPQTLSDFEKPNKRVAECENIELFAS